MGFGDALKKIFGGIGGVLKKLLPVAAPVIAAMASGSSNPVFTAIASAIVTAQVTAEAVGQAENGEGKLNAIVPLAKAAILQLEFLKGKDIADEEKLDGGVKKIAQGVFEVLGSFKD